MSIAYRVSEERLDVLLADLQRDLKKAAQKSAYGYKDREVAIVATTKGLYVYFRSEGSEEIHVGTYEF